MAEDLLRALHDICSTWNLRPSMPQSTSRSNGDISIKAKVENSFKEQYINCHALFEACM